MVIGGAGYPAGQTWRSSSDDGHARGCECLTLYRGKWLRLGAFAQVLSAGFHGHALPRTDWAWGVSGSYLHQQAEYWRGQSDRIWEGPVFASAFIENKDVLGLTMRWSVDNIVNARSRRERVIYQGVRDLSPIASTESRDRLIGPIFIFLIKGSF